MDDFYEICKICFCKHAVVKNTKHAVVKNTFCLLLLRKFELTSKSNFSGEFVLTNATNL